MPLWNAEGLSFLRRLMPQRLPRPCNYPGCPALTNKRFCNQHRKNHERQRGSSTERGYDFQWQLSYYPQQPRRVPAGSWLLVSGAFDNSARNPANPDPNRRVVFGEQSWDEMFIGFFEAADDPEPTKTAAK